MISFFEELLEYTFHFNDKTAALLIPELVNMPEKSLRLLNHTINAQEIWNARIEERLCNTLVWEVRPLDRLKQINENNYNNSIRILHDYDLNKQISYKNSKGQAFTNSVKDILFHIINHATYHRGQIASDCKAHGIEPLISDYIFYKRN